MVLQKFSGPNPRYLDVLGNLVKEIKIADRIKFANP